MIFWLLIYVLLRPGSDASDCMSHFKYDYRLTQINLGHWAELIQMRSLFQNALKIRYQSLCKWFNRAFKILQISKRDPIVLLQTQFFRDRKKSPHPLNPLLIPLTLQVPMVTNINFLQTISIHCQEKRLWELLKWSPKRKCLDLLLNSLNNFLQEMNGDLFGEFVFGYWG